MGFGAWTNDLSGLTYTGLLTKNEIIQISEQLIEPLPPSDSVQFQVASFDLSIGAIISRDEEVIYQEHLDSHGALSPAAHRYKDHVTIRPGGVATVLTREELCLPLNLSGNTLPIIKDAREGLLVLSYGHVDPGYRGYITVRLLNIRKEAKVLHIGDPIITVTFQQFPGMAQPYDGKYKDFETLVKETRQLVRDTAPAAVLDVTGEGIGRLVDVEIQSSITSFRRWLVAGFLGAVALGASLASIGALVLQYLSTKH